jgi:hypothetical protein
LCPFDWLSNEIEVQQLDLFADPGLQDPDFAEIQTGQNHQMENQGLETSQHTQKYRFFS